MSDIVEAVGGVPALFGSNSFNDTTQRERLPKSVYKELKQVQSGKKKLTNEVAEVVANAMKDWALEKGATHYTHWFQPLTGITAEKHDSFISPVGDDKVIMEFSGKELIQGEPDASSFPSGGLRATFEARGYTAWDTASPAFLKSDPSGVTLCIPTAFVGYHGEALDKKTPLLRSMDAINRQAVRVLKALGNTTATRVVTTVGPEQEYFLIDEGYFNQRPDLLLTGRTVVGALPAKGQELEDHYFAAIPDNVQSFMREFNEELWKLGITAKTQHNEVAPHQYELAVIFSASNVATDSNQLVMETMRKVASRHGLAALLHEKPFAGVNGSGKHNNWSMGSDDGQNLLEPGKTPQENSQFLLFCTAVIEAVDKYALLLRTAAGNPGNDHRLGANEAPPAIISIFLGQLEEILTAISEGKTLTTKDGQKLELGATSLPDLPKDLTDRNRTSPFAFTGNKFEFRMVPSGDSIAGPNVVLNTAVAEILSQYADRLEKASDKQAEIKKIVSEQYKAHKRVVFNGNGYSHEWEAEAAKRGLPNIKAWIDCLPEYGKDYSVQLFKKHAVFTEEELHSRVEIYLEKYAKTINIEAGVQVEMVKKSILPSALEWLTGLVASIETLKAAKIDVSGPEAQLKAGGDLLSKSYGALAVLEKELAGAREEGDTHKKAKLYREKVFVAMAGVRSAVDALEGVLPADYYPYPTYEDMLFRF
ncbi:MAG: glutamine synthetase type III [Spirochaetales bacterium]|nr:glutamine synthetase type III [Spirochaetales bacterium]